MFRIFFASACLMISLLSVRVAAEIEAASGSASEPAPGSATELHPVFNIADLSPAAAGEAIFREADRRDSGYQDLKVDLEMILRTSSGNESRRHLRIRQLEVEDDGDRLLVVFDTPKSVRGTALLSYAHKIEPDDQWMYLPALKRVKRIASKNRSGPFLSSEFAYEDMALQEVEKFSYRLLETVEESVAEVSGEEQRIFYVVERVPLDENSGYGRQVVKIDGEAFRIHHIAYFDRYGRALKSLEIEGYEQYAGQFWKPRRMMMANAQTGKSTELNWANYEFLTGLDADRDFSTNSLRRAR